MENRNCEQAEIEAAAAARSLETLAAELEDVGIKLRRDDAPGASLRQED